MFYNLNSSLRNILYFKLKIRKAFYNLNSSLRNILYFKLKLRKVLYNLNSSLRNILYFKLRQFLYFEFKNLKLLIMIFFFIRGLRSDMTWEKKNIITRRACKFQNPKCVACFLTSRFRFVGQKLVWIKILLKVLEVKTRIVSWKDKKVRKALLRGFSEVCIIDQQIICSRSYIYLFIDDFYFFIFIY